ncbi:MAG TPA: Asp-tRNA(Asn)/Glu-tRNA(Gln) amidotransferase subunit GatC [Gemmatimonadales bacterium]|nr:Asp-tRNA(Asn)/Glu-tRNA(Gln) amidotransferase subunit GatC [Gemmatimonadales bacterium]
MRITDKDVRHVARLAELAVPDDKVARLTAELASIVDFVGQLSEVAGGDDAESVVVGPAELRLRADTVAPVPLAHPVASFAPRMAEGFFVVPKLGGLAEE